MLILSVVSFLTLHLLICGCAYSIIEREERRKDRLCSLNLCNYATVKTCYIFIYRDYYQKFVLFLIRMKSGISTCSENADKFAINLPWKALTFGHAKWVFQTNLSCEINPGFVHLKVKGDVSSVTNDTIQARRDTEKASIFCSTRLSLFKKRYNSFIFISLHDLLILLSKAELGRSAFSLTKR